MSTYQEDNSYNKFNVILNALRESINCQLPCKVLAVNNDEVDVLVISNDEIEDVPIYGIPIKISETGRAYIWLGIKAGDWGTLKVYDKSIQGYRQGSLEYDGDSRSHNINDSCFELGFIPDPNSFVYPNGADIEIGLKDGSGKIQINEGKILIDAKKEITIKSAKTGEIELSDKIKLKNGGQSLNVLINSLISAVQSIVTVAGGPLKPESIQSLEQVKTLFSELLE